MWSTTPDFIRPVLTQDYRHFSKRTIDYRVLAQVMGNGLVTNDGPGWVRQRALMQPMFGNRRINAFDGTINALASSVMDEWETRVGGDPVRVDREMSRLTFAIVGATPVRQRYRAACGRGGGDSRSGQPEPVRAASPDDPLFLGPHAS